MNNAKQRADNFTQEVLNIACVKCETCDCENCELKQIANGIVNKIINCMLHELLELFEEFCKL